LQVALTVPVEWRPQTLASLDASMLSAAALRVLQTVNALGEKPPFIADDATGLELEVARLHQKTQLLIELLAVALGRDGLRPAPQPILLGSELCDGLLWPAQTLGAQGLLCLWLHPAAPEPLLWPAEVITAASEGQSVRLLPLGEAAGAALQRQIFLLHRRAVAEARAQR